MMKSIQLFIIFLLISCGSSKNSQLEIKELNTPIKGIYYGELSPNDIGRPYRIYLNFTEDSVFLLQSDLDCNSVKVSFNSYTENNTNIEGYTPLSFTFKRQIRTFIDNKDVDKEYKSTYTCISQDGDSLKFEIANFWYDGTLFSKASEVYYECK